MSITIKDVAKLANVSPGTISNYLNHKANTSDENKKAIENAIKVLGYERNEFARSLRTKKPNTIGVLVPTIANNTIMKMVSSIETFVKKEGYGLLVQSHNNNRDDLKAAMEYLEQRVCGLIFDPSFDSSGEDYDFIKRIMSKMPIVTFDNKLDDIECDSVLVDHRSITAAAVGEFIKRGHTKIGILPGPESGYNPTAKLDGYLDSIHKNNIESLSKRICFTYFSKIEGERGMEELLLKNPDITAVFIGSNRLTIGAIKHLQKISKYNKISVIGYDTSDYGDIVSPPICSITQPSKQLGEMVAMVMLKRIDGDNQSFPSCIKLDASIKNISTLDHFQQ